MAAILHPYRLVPTMSRQPGSEVVRSIMRGGIPSRLVVAFILVPKCRPLAYPSQTLRRPLANEGRRYTSNNRRRGGYMMGLTEDRQRAH